MDCNMDLGRILNKLGKFDEGYKYLSNALKIGK